jgi:hypothetical protein
MTTFIFSKHFAVLAILSLEIIGAMGCTYGPKQKDRTFLESLNGKHYESGGGNQPTSVSTALGNGVLNAPFLKRRRANVKVEGSVYLEQENVPLLPLANQQLELVQDSKVIGLTRSNSAGNFLFLGDFEDGSALIRSSSNQYSGVYEIKIRGFEIRGVALYLKKSSFAQ